MSIKTNKTRTQPPPQPPPATKVQERSSDRAVQGKANQAPRVQSKDAVSQQRTSRLQGLIQQNRFDVPSKTSAVASNQLIDSSRSAAPRTGVQHNSTLQQKVTDTAKDVAGNSNPNGISGHLSGSPSLTQSGTRTSPRARFSTADFTNLNAQSKPDSNFQEKNQLKFGDPPPPPGTEIAPSLDTINSNLASSPTDDQKQVGLGPGRPVDQQRVEDAHNTINDALSQGVLDWDVTHGDLDTIHNTLKDLDQQEFNAVIDRLSNDQLEHLSNELNGTFNGYSTSERREFFDTFAGKANADNLNRLLDNTNNEHDVNSLGEAIAANSPSQVAADFALQASRNLSPDSSNGVAVAHALGGLGDNPALLQRTLQNINGSDLNNVISQATRRRTTVSSSPYGGGHITTSYNAEPLANLLNATSNIRDTDTQARIFRSAANELGRIDQDGSGLGYTVFRNGSDRLIRDGLTNLINSNPNGIVNHLETHDRDGRALTNYLQSSLENGGQAQVGSLINRLMTGDQGSQNATDRFSEQIQGTNGNLHYKNAQNLGYFIGATQSAILNTTNSTQEQAGLVKDIFGGVISAAGAFGGTPGSLASTALGGLTSHFIDSVTNDIIRGHTDLRTSLRDLSYPRSADGQPYEGPAETAYDAAVGRVIDANHH